MSRTNKLLVILVTVMIGGFFIYLIQNPVYSGPEFISEPIQTDVEDQEVSYVDEDGNPVNITLFATYSGYFAVQGVKNYKTDGASVVSPKDFILSWGELPDKTIDQEIKYTQSGRWFYYRYSEASPVDSNYISAHAANTHIIPENDDVERMVRKVGEHDYVYLEGYLAIVHFDGGDWQSSSTRMDVGDGSCEVFYVTDIEIY